MAGKIETGAQITTLDGIRTSLLQGASLCAFISNHAFNAADVAATFTAIEASFGGYTRITLSSWGAVFNNGSGFAETDETVRTWTASGTGLPVSVYGIFVLSATGLLLYSELFSGGPVALAAIGDVVNYQPKYTFQSKF